MKYKSTILVAALSLQAILSVCYANTNYTLVPNWERAYGTVSSSSSSCNCTTAVQVPSDPNSDNQASLYGCAPDTVNTVCQFTVAEYVSNPGSTSFTVSCPDGSLPSEVFVYCSSTGDAGVSVSGSVLNNTYVVTATNYNQYNNQFVNVNQIVCNGGSSTTLNTNHC